MVVTGFTLKAPNKKKAIRFPEDFQPILEIYSDRICLYTFSGIPLEISIADPLCDVIAKCIDKGCKVYDFRFGPVDLDIYEVSELIGTCSD